MNSFNKTGFTLVELIITVIIVGILSIVSVNAYKVLVMKAVASEGVSLMGAIAKAERLYYGEHGCFYGYRETGEATEDSEWRNKPYDPLLGIDARANKYFKKFNLTTASETALYAWSQADEPYNGLQCILEIWVANGEIDKAPNMIRISDTGHHALEQNI